MIKKLGDLGSIEKEEFTAQEIDWLNKFMKLTFRKNITRKDIHFAENSKTHFTYYLIPHQTLAVLGAQSIPKRFLQNKFITSRIPGQATDEKYYADTNLVYWYFKHINDIFDYKDVLDIIFGRAMHGSDSSYDKKFKGYRVLIKHFDEKCDRWSVIKKTFLIGFAIYLGLFKVDSVQPLERIYDGYKNKSLKQIGITIATDEEFGKANHYIKLGLCWHCGMIDVKNGGLCRECDEFWDKRTK